MLPAHLISCMAFEIEEEDRCRVLGVLGVDMMVKAEERRRAQT